jgi:hypothetical protein
MSLAEVLKQIEALSEALQSLPLGPSDAKRNALQKLSEAKHWVQEIPA